MVATAGMAIFAAGKRTILKDLYLDDVAGAKVNWDDGAGAGAATREGWIPPVGVVLIDLAIVTGAAQTRLQLGVGGNPTGDILRHVIQVDTSPGRPKLAIALPPNREITFLQLA